MHWDVSACLLVSHVSFMWLSLQLWIIPSLLGSSLLHFHSEDQWERLSAWVYGAGLSSLFIISTLFHTVSWKKSHLRYVCTPDEIF